MFYISTFYSSIDSQERPSIWDMVLWLPLLPLLEKKKRVPGQIFPLRLLIADNFLFLQLFLISISQVELYNLSVLPLSLYIQRGKSGPTKCRPP